MSVLIIVIECINIANSYPSASFIYNSLSFFAYFELLLFVTLLLYDLF